MQSNHGLCSPMVGDKLVAFWNVKVSKSEHAVHCVHAAVQIQQGVAKLKQSHRAFPFRGVRTACTSGYHSPVSLSFQHI